MAPAASDVTSTTTPWSTLDEAVLDERGGVTRFSEDVGSPRGLVAVDGGFVVVEFQSDVRYGPAVDSRVATEVVRSDLVARRIRSDGTTVWTLPLGVAQGSFPDGQRVATDGHRIWVVWWRFDGTLPATLEALEQSALVRSSFDLDGKLIETTTLLDARDRDDGATSLYQTDWAVDDDGSVAVSAPNADGIELQKFGPDAELQWEQQLVKSGNGIWESVAFVDHVVVAAVGETVTAWNPDGARRWMRDDIAGAVAPVEGLVGNDRSPPVVALSVATSTGAMGSTCVLDDLGNVVFVAPVPLQVTKGWWTERGLLLLSQTRATGTNDSLHLFSPDGSEVLGVGLAGSGDVMPAAGSYVADVVRTPDGGLAVVGSETGYRAGAHDPSDLDSWQFLWNLAPPAANGDLSTIPAERL